MQQIPFVKKFIACVLAGLVMGACALRFSITFLRTWIPAGLITVIPFLLLVAAIVYVLIWQFRKTNSQATLAFWQGLIRYGIAFDLATFGWEKIFHLQLVMPLSKLDLPYSSFSAPDLFWNFFSYSYLFGCIIASIQITGALLLLFRRTRLVGVFILLPVLANILLMDIFYHIGGSVIIHASIMMAGVLYFLFIEFRRLQEFFFAAKDQLPVINLSKYFKIAIRFSIIYIPLLLIAINHKPDKYQWLRGKYEVKQFTMNQQAVPRTNRADSILTVVYVDTKNGCVFEFNTPQRRWYGTYTIDNNHIKMDWRLPAGKPVFSGAISQVNDTGRLMLKGILGDDSMNIILRRVIN